MEETSEKGVKVDREEEERKPPAVSSPEKQQQPCPPQHPSLPLLRVHAKKVLTPTHSTGISETIAVPALWTCLNKSEDEGDWDLIEKCHGEDRNGLGSLGRFGR